MGKGKEWTKEDEEKFSIQNSDFRGNHCSFTDSAVGGCLAISLFAGKKKPAQLTTRKFVLIKFML